MASQPLHITCFVPSCDRPSRWELEDEIGHLHYVCGTHLDTWTAHLWGKYRRCCTQRPYHRTPPKPRPEPQLALFGSDLEVGS
jgi:hypothetical protein